MSLADLSRAQRRQGRPETDVGEAIRRVRTGAVLWVRLLDYDRLHAAMGDRATAEVVEGVEEALRSVCRGEDILLRRGQCSFVTVAARVRTLRAAQGIAARLLRALESPARGHEVGAVLGVCFFPADAATAPDVLRKAELAALQADRARHQVRFYEPSLDVEALEERTLMNELVEGLRRGAFEVVYQPQFDVVGHRMVGAEALARFTSPTRGPVSPGRFVPLLEQAGRAAELTDAIVRLVAVDVAEWHAFAPPSLRISVNLSGAELFPGRAAQLLDLLEAAGAPPRRVTFELTESVWMQGLDTAITELAVLRRAGARLALDDFGSGYSSLGYLASLPVDTVKLDRSFMRDLARRNVRTLLAGVVSMVQALDLHVLVEGVETAEQLSVVREVGAHSVQGYFTGYPEPRDELARRMRLEANAEVARGPRPETARPRGAATTLTPLPLLPSVLGALVGLRAGGLDPEAVVEVAACDPCLSLFIVQLCRAGANPPDRLPSLSKAVLRVGARQVLDRVLAGTTSRVFLPSAAAIGLWTHAIETACWAATIASTSGCDVAADTAYLAGLLHDVGRFPMLDQQPIETLSVESMGWTTPSELVHAERQVMEADHATIGALEAQSRHLPEDICAVIELHHAPARCVAVAHRELVSIVQVADVLAVYQAKHPEQRAAGTLARAARMRRLVAPLAVPLALDIDALSSLWGDVADDADRRMNTIGVRR